MERIAHRGANREFPENTIPAFKRAFELRADAVELDVHATRDGVVVVHHDRRLDLSFGKLSGKPIDQLDWKDLATASVSSATRIPTLSDVLGVAPPGSTVYVEIKGAGIEARVVEAIKGSKARCAIHSFDHAAIRRVRDLAPDIPRGVLFDKRSVDPVALIKDTGARDVWPEYSLIDRDMVERIHAAGARVIAWTVNDGKIAAALAAFQPAAGGQRQQPGVDGICTDDVRLLDGM